MKSQHTRTYIVKFTCKLFKAILHSSKISHVKLVFAYTQDLPQNWEPLDIINTYVHTCWYNDIMYLSCFLLDYLFFHPQEGSELIVSQNITTWPSAICAAGVCAHL